MERRFCAGEGPDKSILIIRSRDLCYYSAGFFLDRIEESLENRGFSVVRIDIDDQNPDFEALSQYSGQSYMAVIDINSKLPYLREDDGSYWLDSIHAPFFNYILDHPLYHHPGLSFDIAGYHVLGIDREHCLFMEENYDHIKSVDMLPVSGTCAVNRPEFEQKSIECLFPGTYIPEVVIKSEMDQLISRFGPKYPKTIEDIINMWDPYVETLEACVRRYIRERDFDYRPWAKDFAEFLNILYPVDRIKRNHIREEILMTLSDETPLTLMGEGWEKSPVGTKKNVRILPSYNYGSSIEIIAGSRIVVDITPAFKCGIHDRCANTLANSSICLSNMSVEYDERLSEGSNIFYFSGKDIGEKINFILSLGSDTIKEIADSGYRYYLDNLTWERHCEKLVEIIKKEATKTCYR